MVDSHMALLCLRALKKLNAGQVLVHTKTNRLKMHAKVQTINYIGKT